MNPDIPMCAEVIAVIPASKQALLRSAGSIGLKAFELLVELHRVPVCVQMVATETHPAGCAGLPTPLHIPVQKWALANVENTNYNLVALYNHDALSKDDQTKLPKPHIMCPSVHFRFKEEGSKFRNFPNEFFDKVEGKDVITEEGIKFKVSGMKELNPFLKAMMKDHKNLVSIEFDSCDNVIVITSSFLKGCPRIKSLDIGGNNQDRKLGWIGKSFCLDCTSLERVRLSPSLNGNVMQHLQHIEASFMEGCTSMTSFEMSELGLLVEIGPYFMDGCTNLKRVSITGMAQLKNISMHFMDNCTALESITLESVESITKISDYFMAGCTSLKEIPALAFFTNVEHIGSSFLEGCTSLDGTLIDFSRLPKIKYVGLEFMKDCPATMVVSRTNCPRAIEAKLPRKVQSKSCCTIQ